MPPKPKFTRVEIVLAAYEIAAEKGIDAVMAREVGKKLGSTARPIFTVFSGMDELKEEVRRYARSRCLAELAGAFDYKLAFKEFGMRWVRFAYEQPHLYKVLFSSAPNPAAVREVLGVLTDQVIHCIREQFGLNNEQANALLDKMIIFSNGIAAFSLNGTNVFDEGLVAKSLGEICIAQVIRYQLLDGTFNPAIMRQIMEDPEHLPTRFGDNS